MQKTAGVFSITFDLPYAAIQIQKAPTLDHALKCSHYSYKVVSNVVFPNKNWFDASKTNVKSFQRMLQGMIYRGSYIRARCILFLCNESTKMIWH